MKESHVEGRASHGDPESYAGAPERLRRQRVAQGVLRIGWSRFIEVTREPYDGGRNMKQTNLEPVVGLFGGSDMGWIGVDLDGALAEHQGWDGGIGKPIAPMVERVKRWLAEGVEVRIMTARVSARGGYSSESMRSADSAFVAEQRVQIQEWCLEHLGAVIPVTHEKDFRMVELWDDRAVQVISNTGRRTDGGA